MFPHFELFGKTISMYSVMAVVGILVAGYVFCRKIAERGLDDTDGVIVLSIAAAGALVGSHLLFALTNLSSFSLYRGVETFSDFARVTARLFGGAVFYGGLIGGVIAAAIAVRALKLDRVVCFDVASFVAPLFHGIARIGCFLGGCCYGIECSVGFSAHGNDWVPAVNDVTRFPVQLLEAACCFALAGLLFFLYRKEKLMGRLFPLYLLLYAGVRFSDEFLRGDALRGFVGVLSTSQFVSVLVALFAAGWIAFGTKKEE